MPSADHIVRCLRERGDLWTVADGMTALGGDALRRFDAIARDIGDVAQEECAVEWRGAPAISLATLDRAEYFASFPEWLSLVTHLDSDPAVLEGIARSKDAPAAVAAHAAPCAAALSPAVCYHAYDRLADTTIDTPRLITMQGTCWRHELGRFAPLEREWAFTMREMICVGSAADVHRFLERGIDRVNGLAARYGLRGTIAPASDPFFAPTARGKALLQRVKGLKRELLVDIGGGRSIAAASFNDHETFFGTAFGIRLASGEPASTGCIAFGLERWLLGALTACNSI